MQDSELPHNHQATPPPSSSSSFHGGKRKGTPVKSISKDEFLNDFEKKAMGIIQLNFTREHRRLHSPSGYSNTLQPQRNKRAYTHREFGWMPRYGGTSDDENYHSSDNQYNEAMRMASSNRAGMPLAAGSSSSKRYLTPTDTRQESATPRGRTSSTERTVLTPSSSGGQATSAYPTVSSQPSSRRQTSPLFKRTKKPNPLDISDAEGVAELNQEEYELCTTLRILPLVYFHAQKTLVENARIRGFYKKSAAQKMLRIDVNKTGKLYDYFYSKGWLPQEPGGIAPVSIDETEILSGSDEFGSAQSSEGSAHQNDDEEDGEEEEEEIDVDQAME